MKKVRSWDQLKKHELVANAYEEDCEYEGLSYWVHLKSGYICTESECNIIHEKTRRDVVFLFNHCVKPLNK